MIVAALVGAHFRPPAKQILQALPAGVLLRLEPEPENPYDAKAIKVFVRPSAVPEGQHEALQLALSGTGFDLQELLEFDDWLQLGFVADSDGKVCKASGLPGNREVGAFCQELGEGNFIARLGFDGKGMPIVSVVEGVASEVE